MSLRVSVVGGSGYAGGELVRLLLQHPDVTLVQVTSERQAGRPVFERHPNLRRLTDLSFVRRDELVPCDLLFLGLPHGEAMQSIDRYTAVAPRLIDLSADFRIKDPALYRTWYGEEHTRPDLLGGFTYGVPELHREAMRTATRVSSAGCNATAVILGLYPLYAAGVVDTERTVIEAKVGSSEGGAEASEATHHPERSGCR